MKRLQFRGGEKLMSFQIDDTLYKDPYEKHNPMQKLLQKKIPSMALPRMCAVPKSLDMAAGLLKKKRKNLNQYYTRVREEWSL